MNTLNTSSLMCSNSSNESWVVNKCNSTIKRTIALVLSNETEKVHGKEVKFIVLCIIILAALLGNGFILWLISKDRRRRRSATNIFIASQCVTDFATSLLVIPFGAASLLQGGWNLGKGFAIANSFLNRFLTALTLLNQAAIGLDRYFAVVKLSHHLIKQRTALCIVVGCWTMAFMTSFPWLPMLNDKVAIGYYPGFLICAARFSRSSGHLLESEIYFTLLVLSAIIVVFPLTIITFSIYHIVQKIKRNRCGCMPVSLPNIQKLQVDAYANSAYTSFIVILSCLIQVFPASIMIGIEAMQLSRIPNDVATALQIIMWSHCALKPIVYAVRKKIPAFGKDRNLIQVKLSRKNFLSSSKTQRRNAYIVNAFQAKGDIKETKPSSRKSLTSKSERSDVYIFHGQVNSNDKKTRQDTARNDTRKNESHVLYSCSKIEKAIGGELEFDNILTIVEV